MCRRNPTIGVALSRRRTLAGPAGANDMVEIGYGPSNAEHPAGPPEPIAAVRPAAAVVR